MRPRDAAVLLFLPLALKKLRASRLTIDPNVRSLLIAVERGAGKFDVLAREVEASPALVDLQAEASSEKIYVFAYPQPLGFYGLTAGFLATVPANDPLASEIPTDFVTGYSLAVGDARAERLTPGALPEALQQFRFRKSSPCFDLVAEEIDTDVHTMIIGVVPLERGVSVVSNRDPTRVETLQLFETSLGELEVVLPGPDFFKLYRVGRAQ